MRITKIVHRNVRPDGTFTDQTGAVETRGKIVMSAETGGCSLKHCSCSEGHWVSVFMPRTPDGIVEGIKVVFDNLAEMRMFMANRQLIALLPPDTMN